MEPKILVLYKLKNSKEPFIDWLISIKDKAVKNRISVRINRLKQGNYGDYQPVGDGVLELRLHFGSGYRIYFAELDNVVLLLLTGGDKSSQDKDIQKATEYFKEYKENLK
jgi:putative addiction module killer protein